MTALGDFSSGDVLTAADLNAIGTWTDYTPSYNNVTVTTSAARYCQINKTVMIALYMVVSAVSGPPGVSVPSGLNIARFTNFQPVNLLDAGVANYLGGAFYTNVTSFNIYSVGASGSYAQLALVNATTPFTWGAGDVIEAILIYEAA